MTERNVLHLKDFKNVRLMGSRTIQLDSTTMSLIKSYLDFFANTLGEQPSKLLPSMFNPQPGESDYTNLSNSFSQVLSKLFIKYNGNPMSMNMIRHIAKSHLIQSPAYAERVNREMNDLHAKLLHSTMAANTSYNKIANRAMLPNRPKDRRGRIFHGAFTSIGSDKTLEIDIFEE
ncbi:uncharacterized protein PITG_04740 [Phytophthora infestans T30-4]|uniref:Uncharacterized protein n=1 Tax=Phytophthora infestans (strain T30-4) TaxID=403677 RepID=D0N1X8_PHYIT|nr:uncharacterized protein PITG_04740 [Phytophthora infestans T30-4]EEY68307.1 conserved hypothetical protein [Phytophthora infestans T30-4]|eukprot:XP_002905466.1 conserved hypothetical protein [Phytophthora infestans T30-4]